MGTKLVTTKNLAAYAAKLLPTVDVDGKIVAAHDTDAEREAFVPARLSAPALRADFVALADPTVRRRTGFLELQGPNGEDITYVPGGAAKAGWQVGLSGPGRIFHLTIDDNTATGELIALGMDFGNSSYPAGILLANKAQSRGMVVDNQATVTDGAAYALYIRNQSTAAPAVMYEQNVAGAAPAMTVQAVQATSGQTLVQFRSNTGANSTEVAGTVRADNGWLTWNKAIRPGQYAGSGAYPGGFGGSTYGSQIFDTTLQRPAWVTSGGWKYPAWAPAAPTAQADTTGATLAALETEVNGLKARLRTAGLMA